MLTGLPGAPATGGPPPEVTIHLTDKAGLLDIKRQLEPLTGIPAAHQKVLLASIADIAVADKR